MLSGHFLSEMIAMGFPERLASHRKAAGLTQQGLADKAGISVVQLRRYEAGKAQPTLDAIRNMAIALTTTTDSLVFDNDERGPDDDLRLQFEALQQFSPEEKAVAKSVIEGLILKHDAHRFARRGNQPETAR